MWDLTKFANNIAVIDENGETYTYAYLKNECDNLAFEVKSGRCLVFCFCENSLGSLVGYVSFINNSIVPIMLDAHLDRDLLKSLVEKYKPDYFWLPEDVSNEFELEKKYESCGYVLMKTSFFKSYPMYEELALLLTTSGSTGSPKLVRQSYENIMSNTKSIVEYLELDSTERPITTLPMSYTYGLSIINSHLYVGATIILTKKTLMDRDFWKQFKANEATSFGGVPYVYEMLDKLRFFRMELPSLRTMTQAGGKLSPELHKKFAEYAIKNNKHFVVMYGQTEATARMSYLPYQKSLEKYGSVGIAIPDGKFSLIDINGDEIKTPNTVGELVYEGANVTLGYAERGEDLINGDEREGKLVTGDMAKFDLDGFYYIVGRKKRFLKIFGSRTNLDETENLLKTQFPDVGIACAGIDDKMWIFITDGNFEKQILQFITEKTGFNRTAFCIKVIDCIPKNEAGKTLYVALEKYYK